MLILGRLNFWFSRRKFYLGSENSARIHRQLTMHATVSRDFKTKQVNSQHKLVLNMSLGEVVFYFVVFLIVLSILGKFFKKSDVEKDYEKKLKERLNDEFLYDPETGARFTIEQAEDGSWINHKNDSRIKSSKEIENYYDGSEKIVEEIANYLKSKNYKPVKLSSNQIEKLEASKLFEKYSDWSYSNSFSFNNEKSFVFFPEVHINQINRDSHFRGYQIMFWTKINNNFGHYYLREKALSEKFFDLLRKDDDFKIDGFEVFTIKENKDIIPIINTLNHFERETNLEIEINKDDLYLKTLTEPSLDDFMRLEEKIQNLC